MKIWRSLLLGGLVACSYADDAFFVRRAGADLPVWRQGVDDSDTVVLMTQGSGASGRIYDWFESFERIEEEVAVVYWDLRGAGVSQGNPADDSLTVDDMILDLDLVRDAVVERYAPERLVLMGHSLGGGLSLGYLRDAEAREGVDGYIDIAGARHAEDAYDAVRDVMIAVAEAEGLDEVTAFYEAQIDIPQGPDRLVHAENTVTINAARGFDQAASDGALASFVAGRGLGTSVAGGFDILGYLGNTSRFVRRFDFGTMNFDDRDLAEIDVPTQFVTGRFDLSVPPEFSEATFEALDPDRRPADFVELEAGHWPMFDAPDGFAEAVLDFLDEL
ncbi:MAG: alpha/beta hydrolase [Myxococcota bacterium]